MDKLTLTAIDEQRGMLLRIQIVHVGQSYKVVSIEVVILL